MSGWGKRTRRPPAIRGRLVLLTVLTVIATLLLGVGFAQPHLSAASHVRYLDRGAATASISASTNNFLFTPNSIGPIAVGATITLTVTQLASTPHTFTLSSLVNYTIPSTATNLTQFFSSHPPVVDITLNGTPGETRSATFTLPTVGFYEFVCTVAGHFQSGMFGFLGYGVTPPNAVAQTGPGAPVFIIGGSIVALVVIALVLAFVLGRRKGSLHEMRPERLGYPETTPPPTPPSSPPKY